MRVQTYANWSWDGPEIHGVQGLARHIPDGSGTHQIIGTVHDLIDHLRSLGYDTLESPDPEVIQAWQARLDFEAALAVGEWSTAAEVLAGTGSAQTMLGMLGGDRP